MQRDINVAILGASGYTGAELLRLLAGHPRFRIAALTADRNAGEEMVDVYAHTLPQSLPTLTKIEDVDWSDIQAVFCCLPHGTTQEVIAGLPGHLKIVDLSADFRLYDLPTYDKWYGHHGWAFSTIRSIAIGQGEVKLTPLHMANLAAIIANKGWYYDPHFVQSPKKGFPVEIQKNQTMVDAKHFLPVIDGMWRVVNEVGGTAGLARINGIDVCGKTGTVENFIGSVKQKNHSVFIAFAPMENPQIAIAVFVENAGFGGTWAAPIASLMIEKYLNKKIVNPAKEKRVLDAVLNKN